MMSNEALGVGDRLATPPSELLAKTAFAHELAAAGHLWHGMAMADLAHALALDDAGLLPDGVVDELLPVLLETVDLDPASVDLDPGVGDIYNNRDRILRDRVGDAAGFIHAGRARREASTIGWQLECRRLLLSVGTSTASLVEVIASVSERHTDALMPDFTYLHRAHPTTLAHYLLGHAAPLVRHLGRVEQTLALVDASPAGSGSTNGSRLTIRRDLLAELLGFGSIIRHTRDAMWAPDMALDLVQLCVQLMTSLDRLAEELQLWTTEAFAFVELPDALSRTSVVMPHKKNPYSLTHLRGAARRSVGIATGVIATQLTASGQPDNRTIAYLDVPDLLAETAASTELMAAVLDGATFDTTAMRAAASAGFTTSTEICDGLVESGSIDNRTAHRLVGAAVRAATEAGDDHVSFDLIERLAAERDIPLRIDRSAFGQLTDPAAAIDARVTPGGAGPNEVAAMVESFHRDATRWHSQFSQHPSVGYDSRLVLRARALLDTADVPSQEGSPP